ncbi:MAG: alpha/beta fold hydrolase [Faecalibacterium sp.]|nr:alpha/beta fold hydrolase [Ruminococcus sp.]MCM1393163.1 alpha/beta fold hydrolase [Ruminococcus sp.]MCM1486155.1 alpha/beta fold hydrolase [Faecalibacterium sp.]
MIFWIAIIILAVLVLNILFGCLCMYAIFGRRCEGSSSLKYFTHEDFDGLKAARIEFPSNKGQILRGAVYTHCDVKEPIGLVVFAHGMGGGHLSYTTEINTFAAAGFVVLAYDNTGTMSSDGKSLGSFYQAVRDLRSALKFVRESESLSKYKVILAGHSWGGYTVCQALAHEKAAGVVSFSGPDRTSGIFCDGAKNMTGLSVNFMRPIFALAGVIFGGKDSYHSSASILAKTDVPVLLLQGDADKLVTLQNSPVSSDEVKSNPNVTTVLYDGRAHNVYQTKRSEKYLGETLAKIDETKKHYKKGEMPDDVRKELYDIDYSLMTEEDPEVMGKVVEFMRNCVRV